MSILITILSRAEIVRLFTDGAEATPLAIEGGHISHTSGGSGSRDKANGSSFPKVVGNAESYYSPHPFFHYGDKYYENKIQIIG